MPQYPEVVAYTFLQPLRRVVRRLQNEAGEHYYDETLECGHFLVKQRGHKRKGEPHYLPDQRRCPRCVPNPPPLKGVTVILDPAVPYTPDNGAKIGFHFVNDAGRVSLRPTNRVRMHPDYHGRLPPEVFTRSRLLRGICEEAWTCDVCGASGKNPGGRATHYRMKHKAEA